MSNVLSKNTTSTHKLPVDATFLWRNGQWHMQAQSQSHIRPVPRKAAFILEQMRASGRLEERAPGLFRLTGIVALPVIDASESPLQRLMQKKQGDGAPLLDAEQFRAGECLRSDYERAHMSARVTANYEGQGSSGGRQQQFSDNHIATLTDNTLEARQKLHMALNAVGPELSGILLHVCCMAGGLEQAELRLNLPRRAGKAVLQLALTRLARHYGYKHAMRHVGPEKIGHWAVEDFKPQIVPPLAHPL
jgi:Domain of unknown function (DUF6456)